jgi:hypothetical protein
MIINDAMIYYYIPSNYKEILIREYGKENVLQNLPGSYRRILEEFIKSNFHYFNKYSL